MLDFKVYETARIVPGLNEPRDCCAFYGVDHDENIKKA